MRSTHLILIGFMFIAIQVRADDRIPLHFPAADIRDVLGLYEKLTGRKVFLALGVVGTVTIELSQTIPKAEAVELIRRTLLETAGIAIRDNDLKESLVDWSDDPKYRQLRETTIRPARPPARAGDPPADSEGKRRIRIIRP